MAYNSDDVCEDLFGMTAAEAQYRLATWKSFKAVVDAVDTHYSASLDHQPGYVRLARAALDAADRETPPCPQ